MYTLSYSNQTSVEFVKIILSSFHFYSSWEYNEYNSKLMKLLLFKGIYQYVRYNIKVTQVDWLKILKYLSVKFDDWKSDEEDSYPNKK